MKKCIQCNTLMDEKETVCPSCGCQQTPEYGSNAENSFDDKSLTWGERLVGTIREVMTAPNAFFDSLGPDKEIGGAFLYYFALVLISTIAALFWQSVLPQPFPFFSQNSELAAGAMPLRRLPFFLSVALIGGLIAPFITAGLYHLVLRLFGEGKRGFNTTLRVILFSQTAAILNIIPLAGSFFANIWSLALQAMGLSRRHHISLGKALLVIFGTIFFLFVIIFLFVVFILVALNVPVK